MTKLAAAKTEPGSMQLPMCHMLVFWLAVSTSVVVAFTPVHAAGCSFKDSATRPPEFDLGFDATESPATPQVTSAFVFQALAGPCDAACGSVDNCCGQNYEALVVHVVPDETEDVGYSVAFQGDVSRDYFGDRLYPGELYDLWYGGRQLPFVIEVMTWDIDGYHSEVVTFPVEDLIVEGPPAHEDCGCVAAEPPWWLGCVAALGLLFFRRRSLSRR